jgi:hypothetical protein
MTDSYCFMHLRGQGNNTDQLQAALSAALPAWREHGMSPWGIWRGLFGVASNEQLVMLAAEDLHGTDEFSQLLTPSIELVRATTFVPTVRPLDASPCAQPGIYVFRFFTVLATDVAEFIELSQDAWTTFEGADAYAAAPKGLFREVADAEFLDMLLVTWYDSLQSWQTSRQPAAEAKARFIRRHQLTRSTVALATVLAPAPTS